MVQPGIAESLETIGFLGLGLDFGTLGHAKEQLLHCDREPARGQTTLAFSPIHGGNGSRWAIPIGTIVTNGLPIQGKFSNCVRCAMSTSHV